MIFSSVLFMFRFLPIFLLCYFVAPQKVKNWVLFFGSLIFYAWGEPVYVVLMLFSTFSDFWHGRRIEKRKEEGKSAKGYLVSSIVVNLALLGFFKYADFAIGVFNNVTGASVPLLILPLPIGISFYTFQTMSYSIDVYRGDAKAQKSMLDFGVFVTMFPQLIAGPIVQYNQVDKALTNRRTTPQGTAYGIRRFILGLGKKVLLANSAGLIWTEVIGMASEERTMVMAWLGIIAYAFQIYFDFSGYSDMAIGLGSIFGFVFPENFNYPYISRSITEFWRRWHMTLGSWFRDYVYIPLGGNRKGIKRQLLNILIVWMLTGIWHGAGWNFLLWGLWFALFLILEKAFLGKVLQKLPALGWVYTMLVVLLGWVFFEISDMTQLTSYFETMFGMGSAGLLSGATLYLLSNQWILLVILVVGATPLLKKGWLWITAKHRESIVVSVIENLALAAILIVSIGYIVESSYNPFLYFRF
ncbi:MAG: MBOAT family protein [Lachnospiraceae bacterium]|nr:MBOAT family protein [Lachnospiraceae bacterium]